MLIQVCPGDRVLDSGRAGDTYARPANRTKATASSENSALATGRSQIDSEVRKCLVFVVDYIRGEGDGRFTSFGEVLWGRRAMGRPPSTGDINLSASSSESSDGGFEMFSFRGYGGK